jgi:hypothetical protein
MKVSLVAVILAIVGCSSPIILVPGNDASVSAVDPGDGGANDILSAAVK